MVYPDLPAGWKTPAETGPVSRRAPGGLALDPRGPGLTVGREFNDRGVHAGLRSGGCTSWARKPGDVLTPTSPPRPRGPGVRSKQPGGLQEKIFLTGDSPSTPNVNLLPATGLPPKKTRHLPIHTHRTARRCSSAGGPSTRPVPTPAQDWWVRPRVGPPSAPPSDWNYNTNPRRDVLRRGCGALGMAARSGASPGGSPGARGGRGPNPL